MMTTILEILKYTLPSLVVFATSYYLLKQYISGQYELRALEVKASYSKQAIPLKLQAYERLLLFCDRISLPSLLLRLRDQNMTAGQLKNAMIISVQKEYEHNINYIMSKINFASSLIIDLSHFGSQTSFTFTSLTLVIYLILFLIS